MLNSICYLIIAWKIKHMNKKKDSIDSKEAIIAKLQTKQSELKNAKTWNNQKKIIISITNFLETLLKNEKN